MPHKHVPEAAGEGALARISLMDGAARALIAHTTGIAQAAQTTHALSATATAALGRALMATAMLASTLKGDDDSLTLSARGGGPLGSVVCVARPDGAVKGYVDHPSVDPPRRETGKLDVGAAVGTDGFLTVIRDLGFGEPYVGRTPLVSGEIAEDVAHYLLHSEQTPSLVALGVLVHAKAVLGAGGAIVQPLPGCPEDELTRLETLTPALEGISRLAAEASGVVELASACLGDMRYEILEVLPLHYRCDCSRERMERVLLSLGEDELRDMMKQQHGAEITCHFCTSRYWFAEEDLGVLLSHAKTRTL